MGMGEPFLNYDNVLSAIRILNEKNGFGLGARHFSISTVGIIEGIDKLAGENLEVNLALSLHAPNDVLRTRLMPVNRYYPFPAVLRAVDNYIQRTRRRVMLEYILIRNVNDSPAQAEQLLGLLHSKLYFVNLIPYNRTGNYRPSTPAAVKIFKAVLEKAGVTVTQRFRFGDDLKAACGQLAADD